MKKGSVITVAFLVLLLVAPAGALAQLCPEPGSGAAIIPLFRDACDQCDRGPVRTCREDFAITLVDVMKDVNAKTVTYVYQVENLPDTLVERDMAHWVLGVELKRFQLALAQGKTLEDLFVNCCVWGLDERMDCGLVLPDPTTQLDGQKFEAVIADGESGMFSLTLDETALRPCAEIVEGCVLAATKAGDEDIQRFDRPTPGYVCIAGPTVEKVVVTNICPRSQGYWKNHPGAWPVDSLVLGCQTYSQEELIAIMKTPTRGDASIILARQLIAAKLNIENGSDPTPIDGVIQMADDLLATYNGKLPYGVRTNTLDGKAMTRYARALDYYNNRGLTPYCTPH